MSWLGHLMTTPRIRIHVPVDLLGETVAVLTAHGLEDKAELFVTPPTSAIRDCTVQPATAAADCGGCRVSLCDRDGSGDGGTTAEVKGKRQLTAHPSDGSTVDTAHPGTGTVFYSIADRDSGGRLQHRLFVEETHGNSEEAEDFGLNDGDDCLDDFSGGQSECFDPGGGDGERVSDAVFEDLDGQGVRTECLNHESCEDVGASIPALPRPDGGGSLECTDPPGPCQPPEAVPEWPMDFDDIALCVNDLDETGIRMTGMTRAFATKFQKGPPRSATKKKAVKKAEQKAKAMGMHDGAAPDQRGMRAVPLGRRNCLQAA